MMDPATILNRVEDCQEALRELEAELSRWGSRPGFDTDELRAELLEEQEALWCELRWLEAQ